MVLLNSTHLFSINGGNLHEKGIMEDVHRLSPIFQYVVIKCSVESLDLVASKCKVLEGPCRVLDVVNLCGDRGHDPEVVTSTSNRPP